MPASGRFLLDTNIVIALLEGDDTVLSHLDQATEVFIPKGRPLPENDIWIAATAVHHGIVLVTRDHHFQEVEDLQIEDWGGRP
jgi:predicted nucleic acid-binding protein